MDQIQDLLNIPPRDRIPIKYIERSSPFTFLFPFLPTIILLGGLYFITRKINSSPPNANGGGGGGLGGMFNVGKSRAKLFNKETDIKISFKNEDTSSSKNDVNNVVNNTTNNNTVNNNTVGS